MTRARPSDTEQALRSVVAAVLTGNDVTQADEPRVVRRMLALLEASPDAPELHAGLAAAHAAVLIGAPPEESARRGASNRFDAGTVSLLVRRIGEAFWGEDSAGWARAGYKELPIGATWPEHHPLPVISRSLADVDSRYDVVVVGAGAGGGIAAHVLAEAGHSVLLVEAGLWQSDSDLGRSHTRNQRTFTGWERLAGPSAASGLRTIHTGDVELAVGVEDPLYNGVATTVGGGTRVYGGQAWRFCPTDFRMAGTYGPVQGAALADWPIGYDELEPHYSWVEWTMGVSGDDRQRPHDGTRSCGYPMAPVVPHHEQLPQILRSAATRLGIDSGPVPMLINSRPFAGRPACVRCGTCVGFTCHAAARAGTHDAMIPQALATGRCHLTGRTRALTITTGRRGRVDGVILVDHLSPGSQTRRIAADTVILAAGAVETARLLLVSASDREPNGLGNSHDLVGRYLQGHIYAGALGVFPGPVHDGRGPGPAVATTSFRHANPGIVGGGVLVNEFVPTPLESWQWLTAAGAVATEGPRSFDSAADAYLRTVAVVGPVQEIPHNASRVTLSATRKDPHGIPAACLQGQPHPRDHEAATWLQQHARRWLSEAGATTYAIIRAPHVGPSAGTHQAGTCRMGSAPENSVTDCKGRVWGHDNLVICDSSLHVTNGGVNPVLTTMALSHLVTSKLGIGG